MKRIINVILVLCLVVAMAVSVSATEFVPSIEIKDAPELVPVDQEDGKNIYGYVVDKDGNVIYTVVEGDILITPIRDVDTSEYISEEAAKLLKETYADLLKSPNRFGHNKVVRELVDISVSDRLAKALEGEGTQLTLTFDLGLDEDAEIWIQAFIDGRWGQIVKVVNNGDGTVTATFEAFCPVVFIVEGDGFCIVCFWLWCLIILLCVIILIMLIVWAVRREKKEADEKSENANGESEPDTTN